jgi:hypothetical protein
MTELRNSSTTIYSTYKTPCLRVSLVLDNGCVCIDGLLVQLVGMVHAGKMKVHGIRQVQIDRLAEVIGLAIARERTLALLGLAGFVQGCASD